MTTRIARRVLAAGAGLLLAAGCAAPASAPAGPSAAAPATTAPPTPQEAPTMTSSTAVTVTVDGRRFPARLHDTATARDLAAQLPLDLTIRDYGGVEKIAPLPRPLTTDGAPAGADPEIDDLGFYAPDGVLVFYYGDVGYWNGIVRIGELEPGGMRAVRDLPDGSRVRLERA